MAFENLNLFDNLCVLLFDLKEGIIVLDKLKMMNEIEIISIFDSEFASYGRILDLDTKEIIKVAEKFDMP